MPEVKNCRRCKNIYVYHGSADLRCLQKLEEEEFEKVRVFVREFQATAQEVSAETGVSTHLIYRFLKEGRLKLLSRVQLHFNVKIAVPELKAGVFV